MQIVLCVYMYLGGRGDEEGTCGFQQAHIQSRQPIMGLVESESFGLVLSSHGFKTNAPSLPLLQSVLADFCFLLYCFLLWPVLFRSVCVQTASWACWVGVPGSAGHSSSAEHLLGSLWWDATPLPGGCGPPAELPPCNINGLHCGTPPLPTSCSAGHLLAPAKQGEPQCSQWMLRMVEAPWVGTGLCFASYLGLGSERGAPACRLLVTIYGPIQWTTE